MTQNGTTYKERREARKIASLGIRNPQSNSARAFIRKQIIRLRAEKEKEEITEMRRSKNGFGNGNGGVRSEIHQKQYGGLPSNENKQVWARRNAFRRDARERELEWCSGWIVAERFSQVLHDLEFEGFRQTLDHDKLEGFRRMSSVLSPLMLTSRQREPLIKMILDAEFYEKQEQKDTPQNGVSGSSQNIRTDREYLNMLDDRSLVTYVRDLAKNESFMQAIPMLRRSDLEDAARVFLPIYPQDREIIISTIENAGRYLRR